MAKTSAIEKNKRRMRLVRKFANRRAKLKAMAKDTTLSPEDRFAARLKLAALPRNGAKDRVQNRCDLTGRPRAVYRKFRLSRLALRELGSHGHIPGLVKASW